MISEELEVEPDTEILDPNSFVIQCIFNRNEVIKNMFLEKWNIFFEDLYLETFEAMRKVFNDQTAKLIEVLKVFLLNLEKKRGKLGISAGIGFESDSIFVISKETERDDITQVRNRESPLIAIALYLNMYLDPKVSARVFKRFFDRDCFIDGIRMKFQEDSVLCSDKPTNRTLLLDKLTFKKLTNTKMFNSEHIFNINEYITEFVNTLLSYKFEISRDEFEDLFKDQKEEIDSNLIGCHSMCPSCGKFCEREMHTNSGRCQIKTGHQICSMGGNVWQNDEDKTAILSTCDDYKDTTVVNILGQIMTWGKFKEKTSKEWDWIVPQDMAYKSLQRNNLETIGKIWNKFGRGILCYNAKEGNNIKFIQYKNRNLYEKIYLEISLSTKLCICFVIGATCSSFDLVEKIRRFVQDIAKLNSSTYSVFFRIVIYRDHCDGKKMIEQHPTNKTFTPQFHTIQSCLQEIKLGTDAPKAVLDGLATATTKSKWDCSPGVSNIIIHIYESPPHGNFPDYQSHIPNNRNTNWCCCCNHGTLCRFDWERDVWSIIRRFNITYRILG